MVNNKEMKFAIIGLGGRGQTYAHFANYYDREITAICDPDKTKKSIALKYLKDENNFYNDEDEFFKKGKLADVLVIATLDTLHHRQAIKAMETGYDLLLEKPIAMTMEECDDILRTAKKYNRKVVVCHVLRYAPLYVKLKELIDSKVCGDIVSMDMTEFIGYYHFAHSYVRGNWRNSEISAPLILAKNCHQLDLFDWFCGKDCLSVSSYGALKFFNKNHAPKDCAKHCCDCKYENSCPFSAKYIYTNEEFEKIAALAKHGRLGSNDDEIVQNLKNKDNVYSRCVFYCDNNVCDDQIVNIEYEDGVYAHLHSTAFSQKMGDYIDIFCTHGHIVRDGNNIKYQKFGEEPVYVEVKELKGGYANHGGGDVGIMRDFISYYEKGIKTPSITSLEVSMLSHKIGFMAEESRKQNGKLIKLK